MLVFQSSHLPSLLLYLAPNAGITIVEYYQNKGEVVLIAMVYRTISLILLRAKSEAYPGDIFDLNSRLLEYTVRLNEENVGYFYSLYLHHFIVVNILYIIYICLFINLLFS